MFSPSPKNIQKLNFFWPNKVLAPQKSVFFTRSYSSERHFHHTKDHSPTQRSFAHAKDHSPRKYCFAQKIFNNKHFFGSKKNQFLDVFGAGWNQSLLLCPVLVKFFIWRIFWRIEWIFKLTWSLKSRRSTGRRSTGRAGLWTGVILPTAWPKHNPQQECKETCAVLSRKSLPQDCEC